MRNLQYKKLELDLRSVKREVMGGVVEKIIFTSMYLENEIY